MSNSSLSNGVPTDATLERALRAAVRQVYKSKKLEDLTVKRVRKSVEKDLDLQDDFFKVDPTWKDKSKTVILSEVDAHTETNTSSQQAPASPPIQEQPRPISASKLQKQHPKPRGKKRVSVEDGGPKKRRRKEVSDDEEAGSDTAESKGRNTTAKAKKRTPSSSMSPPPKDEEGWEELQSGLKGKSKSIDVDGGQSESEMSEVLDEAPKAKGRRRNPAPAKPKVKKSAAPKAGKSSDQPADPDTEEIKRLQGWLIKCGIRKVWGKELAPFDTPKAKIRHLKEMLVNAGMTGRYSAEKANQIKEERELKAELEAVQEGNKYWGKATSDEDDGSKMTSRRKLARGLQGLDFLNDDDGEETD